MEYFTRNICFDDDDDQDDKEPSSNSIKINQKWTSDEAGVVWDASIMMAKYLANLFANHEFKTKFQNKNIVELGAGTGFLGIWMAAMGANVLLTDLKDKLDLIRLNVTANEHHYGKEQVIVKDLDWNDSTARRWNLLNWNNLCDIDYVLVSDCLYYEQVSSLW